MTTEPPHPSIQSRGFLFADLRGYTAYAEAHGDAAAAELLRRYRALVRRVITAFRGAEIRTEGDSFYVVFPSATDAVRAGLAILGEARVEANGTPLRIGIGVHAGETTDTEEGYVGSAVNIAARVCAVAGAGELFVTDTVRALARGQLSVQFVPRGRRRLKGIAEPITVYAVTSANGTTVSPPRRSALAGVLLGRRVERLALPVALAIGVLVLTAAAIALFGEDLAGTARVDPTSVPATSGTPSAAVPGATATAAVDPGAERDAANEALSARIDADVARLCTAADPQQAPDVHRSLPESHQIPVPTIAGLRCELGGGTAPDVVEFWQAVRETDRTTAPPSSSQGAFFQVSGERNLPRGDCSTETRAWGTWEFGGSGGNLLCSRFGGEALLMWTYERTTIIALAVREDGDSRSLHRWWEDHARTLGPEPSS